MWYYELRFDKVARATRSLKTVLRNPARNKKLSYTITVHARTSSLAKKKLPPQKEQKIVSPNKASTSWPKFFDPATAHIHES